ncbi:hypothetical protein [Agarilytica rhodophyticola]|uniref:hypothetical protein n=1 Tax=Agarilytica rhodophyticola TaxID=1737490 RepID=UPI001315407D|nr:hypothetical protein [Agarilytica rhodophyticola]
MIQAAETTKADFVLELITVVFLVILATSFIGTDDEKITIASEDKESKEGIKLYCNAAN